MEKGSLVAISITGVPSPTFKSGLEDALEVGAVVVAVQPQLLVDVCLGQAGGGQRLGSAQVCWLLEELGVRVLPLVGLPCARERQQD